MTDSGHALAAALGLDDRFVRELPGDPIRDGRRRQVLGACHSAVMPTPVPDPELVAFSRELADELGLDAATITSPAFVELVAGNRVLPGMQPFAACYGGHQFGSWAGQLGDGRAIGLGERTGVDGRTWELQLKGAGPTPYSRTADGRAVLRSSLREFVCSEAMHHLGVPTTRALTLVTTGDAVVRDMLYDGHPAAEPGAIVCRVAPTFLRFGSYEIFAARDDTTTLRTLADFTIRSYFPHLWPGAGAPEVYAAWFREVCERTAAMIVGWMRVGFVHGVMNTDNMSILGLTIDYGPYGWIDDFDPDWTPNTTDAGTRRYRFGQQPQVAAWNLAQLGRALLGLVGDAAPLEAGLDAYVQTFEREQLAMFAAKLGVVGLAHDEGPDGDLALVTELLRLLARAPTDMTIFHRRLGDVALAELPEDDAALFERVRPAYYDEIVAPEVVAAAATWLRRWAARLRRDGRDDATRRAAMHAVNPKYVPRNYLAQLAIDDAERGDFARLERLVAVLRRPYDEQPEHADLAGRRPDWARTRVGCSMLSCSS